MSRAALDSLVATFPQHILETTDRVGDEVAIVAPAGLLEIATWLRDTPALAFNMLSDVTAVDYLARNPRFEVVYQLYSVSKKHRLRLRVPVGAENPSVASVTSVWLSANWAEREVWDMYGIHFEGHPDLRRILMYEEFEGHPLRKDYPMQQSQPRMDLRRKERDAVEEYKTLYVDKLAQARKAEP
jgi:NADH-quinone oxidoreductase subunit C